MGQIVPGYQVSQGAQTGEMPCLGALSVMLCGSTEGCGSPVATFAALPQKHRPERSVEQALCAGQGRRAIVGLRADSPYRGTGAKGPVRVEGGSLIGSRAKRLGRVQGGSACAECRGGEPLLRCPEVENLGPGKVDACVNLYWVLPDAKLRRFGSFAAPSPAGKS